MDYKQKYLEALQKAKKLVRNDLDHVLYEEDIKGIFPEIDKEEDERVRNFLIGYFDKLVDENSEWGLTKETRSRIITWLEKQKPKE
jgi:antitoxin component HigA of HigAB toxin-antitoxin module